MGGVFKLVFHNLTDYSSYDEEQSSDRGQLQSKVHSGVTRADIEKVCTLCPLFASLLHVPTQAKARFPLGEFVRANSKFITMIG